MRVWTSGCSIDFGQQTTDHPGKCIRTCHTVVTLTVKSEERTRQLQQRLKKTRAWRSFEEISTLSLVKEMVLNCHLLATTHATKRTAEVNGCRSGYLNLAAWNTMYKKIPKKQVTYHTPKGGKKQLDYILTDWKHYFWSEDAEANDTIVMGSDHRCIMAKFEIPKKKDTSSQQSALSWDWKRYMRRWTWDDVQRPRAGSQTSRTGKGKKRLRQKNSRSKP